MNLTEKYYNHAFESKPSGDAIVKYRQREGKIIFQ